MYPATKIPRVRMEKGCMDPAVQEFRFPRFFRSRASLRKIAGMKEQSKEQIVIIRVSLLLDRQ